MKIAIVGNSSDTMLNFRLSLMKQLSNKNEVFAIAPKFTESERSILKHNSITPVEISLSRVGTNPFNDLYFVIKLALFLKKYRIDASLCYFLKPVIFGTIAAFLAGTPKRISLIEGLGFYFVKNPDELFKNKIMRFIIITLLRVSIPMAHKVVFLNEEDQSQVESMFMNLKTSYQLGGIGVDLDFFKSVRAKQDDGKVRFVMVCRMLKEKGVYEFISASKIIGAKYEEAEFLLIGGLDSNPGGISKLELSTLIGGTKIRWIGETKDVRGYLQNSHVFVLPSFYREGVPRSSQEALAMGLPVITTDVQGCKDTVINGKNGFIVKPKSVPELADAMAFFMLNKRLICQYGSESRILAERNFDSRVKDQFLITLLTSD